NLTGIAFDPSEPTRGYAVGKEGVLLGFGKSWVQEPLPEGMEEANFTGVAFAGNEALVAYRITPSGFGARGSGGLLVDDGSGWRVDEGAAKVLAEAEEESRAGAFLPTGVAGLPDGGAVFSGEGFTLERESADAPWRIVPGDTGGGSIAPFRENG